MRTLRSRAAHPDGSAELARRFAAEYSGGHAASDALFWLEHPDVDALSGAAPPSRALIELRDAVYRQGGTDDDRARYAAARAIVDADAARAGATLDRIVADLRAEQSERISSVRRARAAALGATAVVVVAGVVAVGAAATGSAPAPTPTASTWIIRFPAVAETPDPPDQGGAAAWATAGSQQVATSTSGTPQLGLDPVPDVFRGAVSASGASGVGIVQVHPTPATGVRSITVAVTCSEPGSYSWVAAGTPNSSGIGTAIARSGVRSCTGGPSLVTTTTNGAPTVVQVSGSANEGFDAYVGEFR